MENITKKGKRPPPKLNKYMHPRNPYKVHPNFKELATIYPEFRAHCIYDISGKIYYDFKDVNAQRVFTTCLFDKDFGLKVTIPDNRLVPTLPLRLNYLLWIEDLLNCEARSQENYESSPVIGFDIGTGASCVYPLLGVKKFGWKFIATESDEVSRQSALDNINKNDMPDSIILLKDCDMFEVIDDKAAIDFVSTFKNSSNFTKTSNLSENGEEMDQAADVEMSSSNGFSKGNREYLVDFTLCNPPFFSSEEEMESHQNSRKPTRDEPFTVPTGSTRERFTDGGEISFISNMIEMSVKYCHKIRLFSTMIGKGADVKTVVKEIKERAGSIPVNVTTTEFCQGRTMRWGVAWSFDPGSSFDHVSSKKERMVQKPLSMDISRSKVTPYNVPYVWAKISKFLAEIKIKPQVFKDSVYFIGASIWVYKATWKNQRRKRLESKRKHQEVNDNGACEIDNNEEEIHNNENSEDMPVDVMETDCIGDIPLKRMKLSNSKENLSVSDKLNRDNSSRMATASSSTIESSSKPKETAVHCDSSPTKPTTNASVASLPSKYLLRCNAHVKFLNGVISFEMFFIDGRGKREAMNQLMQFLRNKINAKD